MPSNARYIYPTRYKKKHREALFVSDRSIHLQLPQDSAPKIFFSSRRRAGESVQPGVATGSLLVFFFLFKMGLCTSGVCLVPDVSQAVPVSLDFILETYPTSKQIGSLAWKLSISSFLAATKNNLQAETALRNQKPPAFSPCTSKSVKKNSLR